MARDEANQTVYLAAKRRCVLLGLSYRSSAAGASRLETDLDELGMRLLEFGQLHRIRYVRPYLFDYCIVLFIEVLRLELIEEPRIG